VAGPSVGDICKVTRARPLAFAEGLDSVGGKYGALREEGELVRTACHLVTRHLHLCENQGWVCVIEGWAGLGVRLLICLLVLHLEVYGVRGV